jgi:sterol desaturase/sphingolipid hydroxylase (fatty acid hydroxylase superfamily)
MLIPLLVLGVGLVMFACELSRPGRSWPQVAGWWLRAVLLNVVQVGIVFLAGKTWDGWMQAHRPWSADALGVVGGALVGYLAITFVYYWWHRWRHASDFLWRWLHQVHHSPQRLEVLTSFYKHPFEIAADMLLSSAILYLGVGLGPQAAAYAVLLSGLAELFYHWNVKTPYWLGYVIQRPESHCVHHQDGVHAYNYADLPIWDMLFGTFRNPRRWQARCGFGAEAEQQLVQMLAGVDVSRPASTEPSSHVGAAKKAEAEATR